MRVTDQDTGKDVTLYSTPELTADLAPFYERCGHPEKETRQRRNKGGVVQYRDQCLRCGGPVGFFHKHSTDLAASPPWDEQLERAFQAGQQRAREAIYQKHVEIQRNKMLGHRKEYNLYLQSDAWRQKRAKVLQRADEQCEGCGLKPATEVHHLTYEHVYNEFLFELVAVCDDCHSRLHADDPDLGERHRCCDCHHQGDYQGKVWCLQFDVAADNALAADGDCGPDRAHFEPRD